MIHQVSKQVSYIKYISVDIPSISRCTMLTFSIRSVGWSIGQACNWSIFTVQQNVPSEKLSVNEPLRYRRGVIKDGERGRHSSPTSP